MGHETAVSLVTSRGNIVTVQLPTVGKGVLALYKNLSAVARNVIRLSRGC